MKSLIRDSFQISQDYYPEMYVLLSVYIATDAKENEKDGEACCHKRAFDIHCHMERGESMAVERDS